MFGPIGNRQNSTGKLRQVDTPPSYLPVFLDFESFSHIRIQTLEAYQIMSTDMFLHSILQSQSYISWQQVNVWEDIYIASYDRIFRNRNMVHKVLSSRALTDQNCVCFVDIDIVITSPYSSIDRHKYPHMAQMAP